MYLETMERVLGGSDKIIIDSKNGRAWYPSSPSIKCRSAKRRRSNPLSATFQSEPLHFRRIASYVKSEIWVRFVRFSLAADAASSTQLTEAELGCDRRAAIKQTCKAEVIRPADVAPEDGFLCFVSTPRGLPVQNNSQSGVSSVAAGSREQLVAGEQAMAERLLRIGRRLSDARVLGEFGGRQRE